MTTRLTDDVLATVHRDMRACIEIDPLNNVFIAEVLNCMDQATVDGYDADAAAASLFAFAAVIRTAQLAATVDAKPGDIVQYLASMATLTGQALHAQTHAVAGAEEPVTYPKPRWHTSAEVPQAWRDLPRSAPQVVTFDSVPWPPDRRESIPTAMVGALPTPYQLEALRQYRAALGLPTLISVAGLTAADVNRAVTWWNHRAAMLTRWKTSDDPHRTLPILPRGRPAHRSWHSSARVRPVRCALPRHGKAADRARSAGGGPRRRGRRARPRTGGRAPRPADAREG